MKSLENQILHHISSAQDRVSFSCLQKKFSREKTLSLKKAVASLVRSCRVGYTYEFGNSYLAVSVDRPTVVSERVVLKPPNTAYDITPGQAVVVLERGGAFGLGDHPTTRLAIRLMDHLFLAKNWQDASASRTALDIGTGSGVLAIVAAKLGIDAVVSIDTDPAAVFEARANARLNGLEEQIRVCRELDMFGSKKFDLISANLRTPTLVELLPKIEKTAAPDCGLVLSGIQLEEAHQIRKRYEDAGFTTQKTSSEKGWFAISFARGDSRAATLGIDPMY